MLFIYYFRKVGSMINPLNRLFMKKIILISLTVFILTTGKTMAQNQTQVLIHTDFGDIKVALYNDTPLHRDNFIKLAKEGFYNGSVFHRIIKDFMIQGGGAAPGKSDVTYRIPAEITPRFFHKKGALAAARIADQVNPRRESSGSQFYIVQGKPLTDAQLDQLSAQVGIITPEQREIYKTIGGTPFLDQQYTVFGEVIEGLDVVDKIAAVQTAAGDKPVKDVVITVKVL
jgi:cyclophilin family peptidyl-prolyl cis-trans isomerase